MSNRGRIERGRTILEKEKCLQRKLLEQGGSKKVSEEAPKGRRQVVSGRRGYQGSTKTKLRL